ncbi:hypothetical protein [Mesorhizobium sp. IMUNJ 23232]|uniref:hypothetical protein n=1 Tax=Mesorhizobium sp. IMUNJ 23232 TaxID=3376064 RepID=UPI0037A01B40
MRQNTERGVLYPGESGSAFVPKEIQTGETAPAITKLLEGLDQVEAGFERNSATFREEALPTENARVVDAFKLTFKNVHGDLLGETRAYQEADARSLSPVERFDPVREAAFVASLRSLALPERMAATVDLDYASSSALFRHGDVDRMGFSAEHVALIRDEHRIQARLAHTGLSANYGRKPSLENPLAVGIDQKAARASAEASLHFFRQRGERIDLASGALQSVVTYLAGRVGKHPETVWAELTA